MTTPAALDSLWCRRFAPSSAAARRLVCFPHAGGSAAFFRPVATALSPQIDVVAVQYPGRQDRRREPTAEDIGRLADEIASALTPWADTPLDLFGHSMGALVAFEVALRLERAGLAPARLLVSGRVTPTRPARVPVDPTDEELIADMRRLSGADAWMLEDEELLEIILPTVRSDYRAVAAYQGDPDAVLSAPISALLGDGDPRAAVEETRGWAAHTTGGFDLTLFPGGHFYLVDQAGEVAAPLRTCLDGPPQHFGAVPDSSHEVGGAGL